jgi:8-oxo-dGTP diphosphatase
VLRDERSSADAPLRVVAAILTDGDRVLACRRRPEKSAAGKWEFPGGKVEPGEDDASALQREIREELGVDVSVDGVLTVDDTQVGARVIRLVCLRASLRGPAPMSSTDHDRLEWMPRAQLSDLDWAEPDLPAVRLLTRPTPRQPRLVAR